MIGQQAHTLDRRRAFGLIHSVACLLQAVRACLCGVVYRGFEGGPVVCLLFGEFQACLHLSQMRLKQSRLLFLSALNFGCAGERGIARARDEDF